MYYISILEITLIHTIFVLGMVMSFRLLGFADLTIEGSYTTGGAIYAISVNSGIDPFISLFLSILGGGITGLFTASFHCLLGINKLVSGIITLTILYSINMRIMGRSSLIIEKLSFFKLINQWWFELFILIFFTFSLFIFVKYFLSTKFGLYFRATGENKEFIINLKINPNIFIYSGLFISNALISFSGCLMCQFENCIDINSGNGLLISMLTAMIIGENVIRPSTINKLIISSFVGTLLFELLYYLSRFFKVDTDDLNLVIGVLLISFVIFSKLIYKSKQNKNLGASFI